VTTKLAGAEPTSRPVGADPLAAKATYFLGSDPAGWRSGAPLFSRAVYHGVYRGIDLMFHGDAGSLEYDFVVEPGSSARQIALDISGASALRLESDGALAIVTPAGEIRWKKPEVYQWKDGVRQAVAGAFALHGRRVTFAIGAYDHARELVIDPTLTYATYLGGNDNESSRGVAVDGSGNFYVTGFTFSLNFPVTSGSFQTSYHGGTAFADIGGDAFVAKYTAAGALAYVTYLGGSGDDCGDAITVDSSGNAYVTGFTTSTNFPTTQGSAAAFGSACRCALKNNAGSSRRRCRIAGGPPRQAAYSCPACLVSQRCWANTAAIRWQSSRFMRATGTRYFIATCAEILPSRTCCWIASGRSSTSASRRDTQLTLRSNRRASSSSE